MSQRRRVATLIPRIVYENTNRCRKLIPNTDYVPKITLNC